MPGPFRKPAHDQDAYYQINQIVKDQFSVAPSRGALRFTLVVDTRQLQFCVAFASRFALNKRRLLVVVRLPLPPVNRKLNHRESRCRLPLSRLISCLREQESSGFLASPQDPFFAFSRSLSKSLKRQGFSHKWSWTDLNRRPSACKADALPTELQPRVPTYLADDLGIAGAVLKWARQNSNLGPRRYQRRALTN